MERDKGLIKAVLQDIRDNNDHSDLWINMLVKEKGYNKSKVEYHLHLLHDDGFIKGIVTKHLRGDGFIPNGLTNSGHDYLELLETPWWTILWAKIFDFSGNLIQIALTAIITATVTYYFTKYIGAC